jgi:carbon monoxide dehydrogenase subunit G
VTTSYKGRIQFTEVDEAAHVVRMLAEGRETGGGTAKGTMSSRLSALPGGRTEMVAEASVDLTGRIMQVGRGMIQGVSAQLFQQFAQGVKQQLEAAPRAEGDPAPPPPAASQPIRVLPLLLKTLWAAILRLFRRR